MGRREENKERTRRALLDTALALYRERGFDETRVQDIVERVGVSPATFFNYFPTKGAVLEAQAEEMMSLYLALLRHELTRTDVSVAHRLEETTRVLAQVLAGDAAVSELLATQTSLFFGSTGDKADMDHLSQQLLAELFAQGQADGEIDPTLDPLQLAEIYSAIISLCATNWLVRWWGETDQSLEDRLWDAIRVVVDGAGTRP